MGHANCGLAQHQLQVAALAFRANLSDAAESEYVKGLAFIVEMVDNQTWVEFAQDQDIVGVVLATARRLVDSVMLWRRHRFRYG